MGSIRDPSSGTIGHWTPQRMLLVVELPGGDIIDGVR
jgi:hypothetical protein